MRIRCRRIRAVLTILADVPARMEALQKKHNIDPQTMEHLSTFDPTPNKDYLPWVANHYSKGNLQKDDQQKIHSQLSAFHKLKNKPAFKGTNSSDIGQYDPSTLYKTVTDYGESESNRQIKEKGRAGELVLPKGARLVSQGSTNDIVPIDHHIVRIDTPEAAEKLCSGTNWCVANPETASEYLEDGPLYLYYENGKRKSLHHLETDQHMDPSDEELNWGEKRGFLEKIGRDTNVGNELIEKYKKWDKRTDPISVLDAIVGIAIARGTRWPEAESLIKQKPYEAITYAQDVIKGRWPEAEPAILKTPVLALAYTKKIIKGRWPEAEPVIAQDSDSALRYARDVIKGRWPLIEPMMMEKAHDAYDYAEGVIKGRWPEAEPVILGNVSTSARYARDVIKGRWPEAEPGIKKNPTIAVEYAKQVIKGRWPEAEPRIKRSPESALHYARDVIKGRWPEAEPVIMRDSRGSVYYAKDVIKGRWPEAEPVILGDEEGFIAIMYAKDVIKGRWPSLEKTLLLRGDYGGLYYYAKDIIKGRWPEAEPIITKGHYAREYKNLVRREEARKKREKGKDL